jgi:hypothetical protein
MIWDDNGLSIVSGLIHLQISYSVLLAVMAGGALALFAGFVYLQFFTPDHSGMCQWERIPSDSRHPLFPKWQCRTCLLEGYSEADNPPGKCRETLSGSADRETGMPPQNPTA